VKKKQSNSSQQRVVVFQQNGSGERKIAGVRSHAGESIALEVISIDQELPPVIDDTSDLLPDDIEADLVLDFLTHSDLSQDLARLCSLKEIPLVSSGKKVDSKWVLNPPT
jgi:hypothetical protein